MKIQGKVSVEVSVVEIKELIAAGQWNQFVDGICGGVADAPVLTARQERKVKRVEEDTYKPSKAKKVIPAPVRTKEVEAPVAPAKDFWVELNAHFGKITFSSDEVKEAAFAELNKIARPVLTQEEADAHIKAIRLTVAPLIEQARAAVEEEAMAEAQAEEEQEAFDIVMDTFDAPEDEVKEVIAKTRPLVLEANELPAGVLDEQPLVASFDEVIECPE